MLLVIAGAVAARLWRDDGDVAPVSPADAGGGVAVRTVVWTAEPEPGLVYVLRENYREADRNVFSDEALVRAVGLPNGPYTFLWLLVANRRTDFFGWFETADFDPTRDSLRLTIAGRDLTPLPPSALDRARASPSGGLLLDQFTGAVRVPGGRKQRVLCVFPSAFRIGEVKEARLDRPAPLGPVTLARREVTEPEYEALFMPLPPREF